MATLFASTLWTGFLGWQWRRTRTIPDELKALKKEQAPAGEDGKRPVSPVDARIAELEEVSCSQPITTMLFVDCNAPRAVVASAGGSALRLTMGEFILFALGST